MPQEGTVHLTEFTDTNINDQINKLCRDIMHELTTCKC